MTSQILNSSFYERSLSTFMLFGYRCLSASLNTSKPDSLCVSSCRELGSLCCPSSFESQKQCCPFIYRDRERAAVWRQNPLKILHEKATIWTFLVSQSWSESLLNLLSCYAGKKQVNTFGYDYFVNVPVSLPCQDFTFTIYLALITWNVQIKRKIGIILLLKQQEKYALK